MHSSQASPQSEQQRLSQRLMIDARLDRLEHWPWAGPVLVILGLGFLWAYFDIGDLAAVLPRVGDEYGVGLGALSHAASLGLYGYIAGGVLASLCSDLLGRRVTFVVTMCVVAVASVLNAWAPNMAMFDTWRFVSGAGIGGSIGVISAYLSELSPARVRGRYSAWGVFPALIGLGAATAIALGLVVHVDVGWRLMLMIPVLALVPAAVAVFILPESPRWLAEKGRQAESEALVDRAEQAVLRKTGNAPLAPVVEIPAKVRPRYPFFALFLPPQLKWTLLMFLVWFTNYLPVYSATIGITVLTELGYTLQTSIALSLAGAAGGVVGALIAPHITDRWSRKYPAIAVSLLACVFYVLVALHRDNVTIALAFGFGNFQVGIFAPLVYTLTAEHFPTEARTVGIGVADGVGHVGGAIGPTVSSSVFSAFAAGGYFVFLGSFFALTAVMVSMAKNTVGRTLEELRSASSARTMTGIAPAPGRTAPPERDAV